MTQHAMILAGGRATRLGPLATQLNKCLVPYAQRPLIVHQVERIRAAYPEVTNIHVVVSPASVHQVASVIEQSMSGFDIDFHVVVQPDGIDPGDGLLAGLEVLVQDFGEVPLLLVMADTLAEIPRAPGNWIGTKLSWELRRWCVVDSNRPGFQFTERELRPSEDAKQVSIGVYHFSSSTSLYGSVREQEILRITGVPNAMLMAPILNVYAYRQGRIALITVGEWLDFGELDAAAEARRAGFIARSFNTMHLDHQGVVTKYSDDIEDEKAFMLSLPAKAKPLFPTVYDHDKSSYSMEYLDLPTLAELWLYWQGAPAMWSSIANRFVQGMEHYLWSNPTTEIAHEDLVDMYIHKVCDRWDVWGKVPSDRLVVNGESMIGGPDLLEVLLQRIDKEVIPAARSGMIHGDPNLCNILWSLSSQTFKLVDPRGRFGTLHMSGDVNYDAAKFRYSYNTNYPAIAHGLFTVDQAEDAPEYTITLAPVRRQAEIDAMDRVLEDHGFDLRVLRMIESVLCLSAAPLHHANPKEELALYLSGVISANELLKEEE